MSTLLVPIDFSDVTNRVINSAEQMARALHADVLLMHCASDQAALAGYGSEMPIMMTAPDLTEPAQYSEQKHQLEKLATELRNRGVNVESRLVVGTATDEILSAANTDEVEMIIMGSHGHGALYELMVGTVTKSVVQHTRHAVLIIPSETQKEAKAVPVVEWEQPMVTQPI